MPTLRAALHRNNNNNDRDNIRGAYVGHGAAQKYVEDAICYAKNLVGLIFVLCCVG